MRSFVFNSKNFLELKWKKYEKKNSQYIKNFYHDVGMFYIYRIKNLLKNKKTFPSKTVSLILKKYETFDINDMEDFNFFKKVFK